MFHRRLPARRAGRALMFSKYIEIPISTNYHPDRGRRHQADRRRLRSALGTPRSSLGRDARRRADVRVAAVPGRAAGSRGHRRDARDQPRRGEHGVRRARRLAPRARRSRRGLAPHRVPARDRPRARHPQHPADAEAPGMGPDPRASPAVAGGPARRPIGGGRTVARAARGDRTAHHGGRRVRRPLSPGLARPAPGTQGCGCIRPRLRQQKSEEDTMTPINAFLVGIGTMTALAVGMLWFVRASLMALLRDLCREEHRAQFWAKIYAVGVVLLVLLAVLIEPPGASEAGTVPFAEFVAMFRAGMFGLLAAIGLLAFVAMQFIQSQ